MARLADLFAQHGVERLEVAFLEYGEWPAGSFADDVAELAGLRARVVSFESLKADKAVVRDDAAVAAKDRIDSLTLEGLS